MRRNEAFPSKYLGKDDLADGPIRGAIEVVQPEEIKGDGGTETKPVLYLKGGEKGMIVNGTNWDTIAGIAAEKGVTDPDDSDQWIGLQIELYNDPSVMFGKKRVGGVRIRKPAAMTRAPAGRPAPRRPDPQPEPEPADEEGYEPPGGPFE